MNNSTSQPEQSVSKHSVSTQAAPIENLADFIEASMEKHHDLPAYSCLGQTLTFAEIEQRSRSLAAWLQQNSGLVAGDRVIIQLPNINQYPIAAYAVLRAGMVIVNTNPLYTAREMQHQFCDSGAKAIIILADLIPKLSQIKEQTEISQVIVTSPGDLLNNYLPDNNINEFASDTIAFNQAIHCGERLTLQTRVKTAADDTCILQYTGGTTGISKGACLSHNNIIACAGQILQRFENKIEPRQEVVICPLPLYHIYAFTVNMMTLFSQGNLTVLIPNPRNLDAFVEALSPYRMTIISGINTLFVGLCQHEKFKSLDFSGLKLTVSGGSTLTSATSDIWTKTTGCTITEGYGLSESSAVVCLNVPDNEHLGAVGQPTVGTEVQLWDENDVVVADGEEGQVVVRGPQMLKGYWNMPDETLKAISAEGFFKTGDVGIRLPDGCIKIVDRLKDMIIVSGFNVYPNEVEAVLTDYSDILEAAVIGEADDKTGEKVSAYITVKKHLNEDDIIAYCRTHLTAYKVPKKITIIEELPKSTVGKILRRELRATIN
jgi:long-chain acyl-CoA synthetase